MNFLVKLFVKNYKETEKESVRKNYGTFASVVGIILNLLISSVKMTCGFLFHSMSVTADGFNNLSDTLSSGITFVGIIIANKPADEKHPHGHQRMEYLTALFISTIVILLGLGIGKSAVERIFAPKPFSFSFIVIAALIFSLLIKLFLYFFYGFISKKINSIPFRACKNDSLIDILSTSAILISYIISKYFAVNPDGYLALFVALFIIYSGVKIVLNTVSLLLGEVPSEEFVDKLTAEILSFDGVLGVHDLIIHSYGENKILASVHVELPASQDILISHEITDIIENRIKERMNVELVVHLDPIETDNEKVNELKDMVGELLRGINDGLSFHDFRVVFGVTQTNMIFDINIPFKIKCDEKTLLAELTEKIKETNSSLNVIVKFDKI